MAIVLSLGAGVLLLFVQPVQARVGGGHSYSGGHSSGGHSYSGGVTWGSRSEYSSRFGTHLSGTAPTPGTTVFVIFLLILVFYAFSKNMRDVSLTARGTHPRSQPPEWVNQAKLETLRKTHDPEFSKPAFLDFTARLFAEIHQARGGSELDSYSLFLRDEPLIELRRISKSIRQVGGIALGAIRTQGVEFASKDDSHDGTARIRLYIDACYTEFAMNGSSRSWYVNDIWTLERNTRVRSQPPERLRLICCPSCGAAPKGARGICGSCGTAVNTGAFHWVVTNIKTYRQEKPPLLTQEVQESGTELPTLLDPEFKTQSAFLHQQLPNFNWESFRTRALHIFVEAQRAWKERNLTQLRAFETDCLFSAHSYWIEEYRRQKLINDLGDLRIINFIPVKIQFDAFFASITVRIHARMTDVTRREDGSLLFGNPRRPREFTEYWTFIRSRKAPSRNPERSDCCPSCGAELKITQAGNCEYCSSHIVAGEFDWVASLIEQDEAYHG